MLQFVWLLRPKFFLQTEQMKDPMKVLLWLDSPFKASCFIAILFTEKNSSNEQGWNSIHKPRRWKSSWRESFSLYSTFKTICYIEILFTKNSLNRQGQNSFRKQSKWKATPRNFYDLIQPSKLAILWQFYPQTSQMKGLMMELFLPWFKLQN